MAIGDGLEQVALPEQLVVVQVGNKQAFVQRLGGGAGRVGRGGGHAVHLAVEQGRQAEEHSQADHRQGSQGEQAFTHDKSPGLLLCPAL